MKKNILFSFLAALVVGFWFGGISSATEISEIRITSSTTSVEPWTLPTFTASTTTAHASIDMGNSNWMWSSNGAWVRLETPTAVDDGKKHYWLNIAVDLDNGYEFADDVTIYFNGNDVTSLWFTKMWQIYSWWGYLTIDLWTAWEDLSRTVTYDANGWNWTMSSRKVYVWDEVQLGKCKFTPPAWKVFKAWQINGEEYMTNEIYTISDNVTAKALWKDDVYIKESRATMSPSTINSNISANDLVFTSSEPNKYTVKLWRVFDKTDSTLNTSSLKDYPHSSKFIAGHDYLIEFEFSAVAPYQYDEINSDLCWPFYLNDQETNISAATALSCSVNRWLVFTAEWGKFTVAAETKVPNVWDSAYDYMYEYKPTISTNNVKYYAHDWYDEKWDKLTSFEKFGTWKTYTLKIRATSTSEKFNSNTEATINGNKAKILDYSNWLLFSYDFSLTTKQRTVNYSLMWGTMDNTSVKVNNGEKATKPSKDPTKDGYSFGWWYSNSTLTKAFDFNTTITSDITLYAKWIKDKEIVPTIVTKITIPVEGGSIDSKPTISTSDVSMYDYDWYKDGEKMSKTYDKFELGHTYRLKVRATSSSKQFDSNTKATINDKTASIDNYEAGSILYYYDFTLSKEWNYTVTFDLDWGKMSSSSSVSVKDWEKITKPSKDPTKDDYKFEGWYSDAKLTKEFDFDTKITENTTIYAKWTSTKTEVKENENKDKEEVKDTEKKDEVKDTENKNENKNENKDNTENKVYNNWFSDEFNEAYEFAFKNWITTMDDISKADMNGGLTRIAMGKMLSQYAINILGKTPDTSKTPNFKDVPAQLDADYNNWVTLAYQLGIMGVGIDKFRPYDWVTRAEFGTALSRMLYGL